MSLSNRCNVFFLYIYIYSNVIWWTISKYMHSMIACGSVGIFKKSTSNQKYSAESHEIGYFIAKNSHIHCDVCSVYAWTEHSWFKWRKEWTWLASYSPRQRNALTRTHTQTEATSVMLTVNTRQKTHLCLVLIPSTRPRFIIIQFNLKRKMRQDPVT